MAVDKDPFVRWFHKKMQTCVNKEEEDARMDFTLRRWVHKKTKTKAPPASPARLNEVSWDLASSLLITIAADLASSPEVGSSINIIEGFATSSTAIVNLLRCSVDNPVIPGNPTNTSFNVFISTSSITSSMNIYIQNLM
ncbi:hypothetical protein M5K25_004588 [Dendrobium thyrsiflorum]|uniref:Uncharacterized protein n=1 Tax=Dendrobium thyrsiflorum TaxID=117978 RepID=A0ABD0VGG4_DENTH